MYDWVELLSTSAHGVHIGLYHGVMCTKLPDFEGSSTCKSLVSLGNHYVSCVHRNNKAIAMYYVEWLFFFFLFLTEVILSFTFMGNQFRDICV